jgi:hypothetical protein
MKKPLAIPFENWRSRWVISGRGTMIHRLAKMRWEDDDPEEMIYGVGEAICGKTGSFRMPGIFTRMGGKRCPQCCKAMNIPNGNGHPYNEKPALLEPGDAEAIAALPPVNAEAVVASMLNKSKQAANETK